MNTTEMVAISDVPDYVYVIFMCLSVVIVALGSSLNGMSCYVIARSPVLHTTTNMIIFSMCISEFLCTCCVTPLIIYSNYTKTWPYSQALCAYYGASTTTLGLVSMAHLAVGSIQRIMSYKRALYNSAVNDYCFYKRLVLGIWFVCIVVGAMPFLGLSRFTPEGVGTSCALDYNMETIKEKAYFVFLVVAFYIVPLTAVLLSTWLFTMELKLMTSAAQATWGFQARATEMALQFERKVSVMFYVMAASFICAWTPYTIKSFLVFAGVRVLSSPLMASIPAFIAKLSFVCNPIIYSCSCKQFRKECRRVLASIFPLIKQNNVEPIQANNIEIELTTWHFGQTT